MTGDAVRGSTHGRIRHSALERDCDKKSRISCHDLIKYGKPHTTAETAQGEGASRERAPHPPRRHVSKSAALPPKTHKSWVGRSCTCPGRVWNVPGPNIGRFAWDEKALAATGPRRCRGGLRPGQHGTRHGGQQGVEEMTRRSRTLWYNSCRSRGTYGQTK